MSEETKVTKKDLHEKLWESRSFELNHLWQRSIFLATFIVALFTLYFSVLNLYYTEMNSSKAPEQGLEADPGKVSSIPEDDKQEPSEDEQKTKYNTAIFFVLETICFFGFQFSVLWICMARGSKYMYERHEHGIDEAYKGGSFENELNGEIEKEFYEILWASGDYTYIPRHGALPLSDYDYRAFHLEGGKFSSSKINIIIGYIFSSAWVILTFISTVLMDWASLIAWLSILVFLFEILCAIYTSYVVLSDNKMNMWGYIFLVIWMLKIPKLCRRKFTDGDSLQIQWIMNLYKPENKQKYGYVLQHTSNMLLLYMSMCDNTLQRILLSKFICYESNRKVTRNFVSNVYLKNIFETALMYRESFSDSFIGEWCDVKHTQNRIKIDSRNIVIHLDEVRIRCYLKGKYHNRVKSKNELRLFADTDWRRIRSGYLDYDLIEDARCQHLIWKKVNGDTLYMTMDISPSISDLEFYYDCLNNDIENSELMRMKVSIIWKDKKHEYTLFRS